MMGWIAAALAAETMGEAGETGAIVPEVTVDLAEEAELLFRRGIEAYRARRYTDALEYLLASNRIVPNRVVVFDLARTYEELGQLEQAWRYYTWYAALEEDPARRSEAERALERLTPRVARVSITTNPPGAAVYLDGRALGRRGFTPMVLALPPGTHHVVLEREGHALTEIDTEVAVGKLTEVEVSLAPERPQPGLQAASAVVWGAGERLVQVEGARCEVLGIEGRFEPSEALWPEAGSALALQQSASGLQLDVAAAGRSLRTTLAPRSKKDLSLVDPAPLHAAIFERCTPLDESGLVSALSSMEKPIRREAVRLMAEWAAWRGGQQVPEAASACLDKGSCGDLAHLLTAP